jgi:secondary thiamine-phosphate synthase enzyme
MIAATRSTLYDVISLLFRTVAGARSSLNAIINLSVDSQGLYDITHKVHAVLENAGSNEGLVTLFIRHTSASLLIQENADPAARRDLEHWLNRLVPENDPLYTHTQEGPDDMPAHIKAALTATSLSIPLLDGVLALGTWQGIFLWEHRHRPGKRQIVVNVLGS